MFPPFKSTDSLQLQKLSQNAITGRGDTHSKTFGLLKLPPVVPPGTLPRCGYPLESRFTLFAQNAARWARLSQNITTGRGDTPPGPSPEWRYSMKSRFTIFALDLVRVVETLDVSAPNRAYRRFRDLFGTTSMKNSDDRPAGNCPGIR